MLKAPASSRLSPEQLCRSFQPEDFPFEDTDSLESFHGILGQERAIEALQFGVAMHRPGYNIFVAGEPGTGRFSFVRQYLQAEAKRQHTPDDWLYVNRLDTPRAPHAIRLPPGRAADFAKDCRNLIDNLLATFPAVFETPTYQQKKSAIDRGFNRKYDRALDKVERLALEQNVALYRDNPNIAFTPMKDGKALDETDFAQLPEVERETFHQAITQLEEKLNEELINLPQWKRESSNRLRQLNEETILLSLQPLIEPLQEKYAPHEDLCGYLTALRDNLLKTVIDLLVDDAKSDVQRREALEALYSPNLFVQRSEHAGAPVIHEPHPSYDNLFGRIEYASDQGALYTSYLQLRPGALHQANGGYLILEAEKLLTEPFVWEALKRSLQARQLKMESPLAELNRLTAVTLTPQVIPLSIKIVLIGSRRVYYSLQDYDPDFRELFRVLADFDREIATTADYLEHFPQLLGTRVQEENMAPLTGAAVARLATYSARLADHQHKFSARIGDLFELINESDFIRQLAGDARIDAGHVNRALLAQRKRTGRIAEEIFGDILSGTILLDTQGSAVGKCNGLTVLDIGDCSFGVPARISATVYPGGEGIVDIEREVNLGQSIHSKGVMLLTGYLGNRYARDFTLEISASIALEQSYDYIDGDSASLGEVCTLISAITAVPLQQNLSITGSMNQFGEVQAIGGVNEKIEGFFRLCAARGLTGDQGVIIPHANIVNLMLENDVIEAVRDNRFHIHAVHTADQALSLLTGLPAGDADEQGDFPEGSLNARVVEHLRAFSELDNNRNENDKD